MTSVLQYFKNSIMLLNVYKKKKKNHLKAIIFKMSVVVESAGEQ